MRRFLSKKAQIVLTGACVSVLLVLGLSLVHGFEVLSDSQLVGIRGTWVAAGPYQYCTGDDRPTTRQYRCTTNDLGVVWAECQAPDVSYYDSWKRKEESFNCCQGVSGTCGQTTKTCAKWYGHYGLNCPDGGYFSAYGVGEEDFALTAIRGVEHRRQMITSGRGSMVRETYRRYVVNLDATLDGAQPQFELLEPGLLQFRWWFSGDKVREEQRRLLPERMRSDPDSHTIIGWDGVQGYTYSPLVQMESLIASVDEFYEEHSWGVLSQLCIPQEPVHPIPSRYRPAFQGWENIDGHRTVHLTATELPERELQHDWWVAPDLDFLVLREEEHTKLQLPNKGMLPSSGPGSATKIYRTKVTGVQKSGGVYIPATTEFVVYLRNEQGRSFPVLWNRWTISDVQLNIDLDASVFRVIFPLGTEVAMGEEVTTVGPDVSSQLQRAQSDEAILRLFSEIAEPSESKD